MQQFFASVRGSEVCGPEFTPDNRTLFLAIQHPGEGGTFAEPLSTWPDRNGQPRPSVLTIQASDGSPVGQVPDVPLPDTGITPLMPSAWMGAAGLVAVAIGTIIRRRIANEAQHNDEMQA